MIFYNPFFPPFLHYQAINSTNHTSPVNKSKPSQNKSNHADNDIPFKTKNLGSNTSLNHQTNLLPTMKKNSHKKPNNLEFLYDYFQDTDTLIILGLLYFLYNQETQHLPLMLCLFLLLFEE